MGRRTSGRLAVHLRPNVGRPPRGYLARTSGSISRHGLASARVEAARQLFSSLGGTLEHFYFAFAPDNLVVICDLPDNEAAFSLAINNSGAARGMSPHCCRRRRWTARSPDHPLTGPPGSPEKV